jgi:hypothetical protein
MVQSYTHSNRSLSVVCLRINTCWCLVIKLPSSKKSISLLFIILSITRQHVEVNEIGLKLIGSLVSLFLCIGITWASFQLTGRLLSLTEVSKMWLNGTDKAVAQFLSRTSVKPSGPAEVLGFQCIKYINWHKTNIRQIARLCSTPFYLSIRSIVSCKYWTNKFIIDISLFKRVLRESTVCSFNWLDSMFKVEFLIYDSTSFSTYRRRSGSWLNNRSYSCTCSHRILKVQQYCTVCNWDHRLWQQNYSQ